MSAGLSIFLPVFGVRSQETARPNYRYGSDIDTER